MTFPNQLTILRILLTPVIVYFLTFQTLWAQGLAFILFFIASLTDWYDGYIARKSGAVSAWGRFLDPLADKILVLSMFIAFVAIGEVQLWMVIVIALRDVVITLLRIYAVQHQKPMATSVFAKWKTASQMAAIYLIFLYLILKQKIALAGGTNSWMQRMESIGFVDKVMYVVTLITATSGLHYLIENRHHVKGFALSFCRMFLPNL